jgi:hypothetical protein
VIDDDFVCRQIGTAQRRLMLMTPAVSLAIAQALVDRFDDLGRLSMTIILDPDADVYRLGYGEPAGLALLQEQANIHLVTLREQRYLRLAVLVADDDIVVWSPIPKSVDPASREISAQQVNGIAISSDTKARLLDAVAIDDGDRLPSEAEIGNGALLPEKINAALVSLKKEPTCPCRSGVGRASVLLSISVR